MREADSSGKDGFVLGLRLPPEEQSTSLLRLGVSSLVRILALPSDLGEDLYLAWAAAFSLVQRNVEVRSVRSTLHLRQQVLCLEVTGEPGPRRAGVPSDDAVDVPWELGEDLDALFLRSLSPDVALLAQVGGLGRRVVVRLYVGSTDDCGGGTP